MTTLSFGLNVKPKAAANGPPQPPPKRAAVFGDDDSEPEDAATVEEQPEEISVFDGSAPSNGSRIAPKPTKSTRKKPSAPLKPPTRKQAPEQNVYADLSSDRVSNKHASTAAELDAAIYDYDAFHDAHTSVTAAKKAAAKQDAVERKPKYMNNLLDAASKRKQDQLIAREKLLQKEREAEGDEFADKEKFVTGAYKAQQEEARRLEEEEKKKAEEEEKRRKQMGGGMQGFYRTVMADEERRHQEAMEAAKKLESGDIHAIQEEKAKSDAELAAELKAKGVNVHINEDGQITDKRQLLSAGLNVAPSGKSGDSGAAEHLKTSNQAAQPAYQGKRNDQRAMRERQTRLMEQQLAESAKRAADDEAEERRKLEHAAKSRKTETEISSAKERYLARKRAAELEKKNGG
ncbi:hypothetical protein M8818_005705 [Zalaria obscura]|uniref:Uncharacterized protein n=1 Tax=Zalaria obscura TaxID=2024903 RepID=A0ACC3S8R7_9PEZI